MNLISVKNLSAFYENREIFSNLSFNIADGDYLCILGENGSGKTTLMRCMLGFDVKTSGEILFNGFSKKEIGYLPQRSETVSDFPASVTEVVMSGFAGKGFLGMLYKKEQKQKAYENMKRLEIFDLKDKAFNKLSGGQQQKVLLCRALCAAKKALLLDEPVTGLDANSAEEMYALIDKLNREGMTVIMISHDIETARSKGTHILHIANGGYFFGTEKDYASGEYCKKEGGI